MQLSYSSVDIYKQCKRWFYLRKVARLKVKQNTMYADRGNVVHKCLEYHYSTKPRIEEIYTMFNELWADYQLEKFMPGKRQETLDMIQKGMELDLNVSHNELELKYNLPLFIGYIDAIDVSKHHIHDYKTSTFRKKSQYDDQMITYSWLYYKIYGKIPTTFVHFLKVDRTIENTFTLEAINNQGVIINVISAYINQHFEDKAMFPRCGDNPKKCPHWCPYKQHCFSDVSEYISNPIVNKIDLIIQNNSCFLRGDIHPKLLEGLDYAMKYNKKDKYFMQKNSRYARGTPAFDEIGVVHLFHKEYKMFSVGHIPLVKKILHDYEEYSKVKFEINVIDNRNQEDMNYKISMPDKLYGDKELRNYQVEAVDEFIRHKMGCIQLPTATGKTMITAEIIRRLGTRTLWIIDRKELLYQTKKEFEEMLGIKIGIIGDGEMDVQDVTCATIQTISKRIFDPQVLNLLNSINFVIVDEGHHAKAPIYQRVFKELKNTKYRLATTATYTRDDGDTPIIKSLIGDIIYTKPPSYFEEMGYRMKPEIIFYQLPKPTELQYFVGSYQEYYNMFIMNNHLRNVKIYDLIKEHEGMKFLVLTKLIKHGKMLNLMLPDSCFIHGSLKSQNRKKIFADFKNGKLNVLIGTSSIFSEGVDIPDLNGIINATANRGNTRTVQGIGRVLRMCEGKNKATYYDFMDHGKHFVKASKARIKSLEKEGHEVTVI